MLSFLFLWTLFVASVWCQDGGAMTIDTPIGVVSGLTTTLTFRGGLGPYMIQVLPAASPSDFALATYTTFGSPYVWQVDPLDTPAGTSVFLRLRDVTGRSALTASFAIQAGPSAGSTATGSSTLPSSTPSTPAPVNQTASSSILSQNSTTTPTSTRSNTGSVLSSSSPGTATSSSATDGNQTGGFGPTDKKPGTGLIIGVTVGGVAGLLILIFLVSSIKRRMKQRRLDKEVTDMVLEPQFAPLVPPGAGGTRFDSYNSITTASSIPPSQTYKHTPVVAAYYEPHPFEHETRPSTTSFISSPVAPPPPPTYNDQAYMESVSMPTHPTSNFTSDSEIQASTSGAADLIGQYAAANRDLISSSLESKLRAARYHPMDNPGEISASEWQTHYQVGVLELKRLQEAYDRSRALGNKEKAFHSAAQAGPSWRPS